jgi:hypothetical protein
MHVMNGRKEGKIESEYQEGGREGRNERSTTSSMLMGRA